jgi:hypothetical protein
MLDEAKKEVEANMEKYKWQQIEALLQTKSGVKYGVEACQKKYKLIERAGGIKTRVTAPTPALTNRGGSEEAEGDGGQANGVEFKIEGGDETKAEDEEIKEEVDSDVKNEDEEIKEPGEDGLEDIEKYYNSPAV